MEYLIRKCEERDLDTLVQMCSHHAAYERADYQPEGKLEALQKALFVEQARLFCLVVENQNRLVGYASYTFDFSTWDAAFYLYLDCLYLEPEARGFGIGAQMMLRLQEIAKGQNCVNMQWQTPNFNERAIRFYSRLGAKAKEKARFFWNV